MDGWDNKVMTKLAILTAVVSLLAGPLLAPRPALAQKCSGAIPLTSPASNFSQQGDGTATDRTTGLMWMRCALGQQWQGGRCQGPATLFNWNEALKAAAAHEFAGYGDWRLPNKNELGSLVEQSCVAPAINLEVFPATPAAFFWTGSPYANLATGAWSVDFGYGSITATEKTGKIHVRLVRDHE